MLTYIESRQEKLCLQVSDKVRHELACTAIEKSYTGVMFSFFGNVQTSTIQSADQPAQLWLAKWLHTLSLSLRSDCSLRRSRIDWPLLSYSGGVWSGSTFFTQAYRLKTKESHYKTFDMLLNISKPRQEKTCLRGFRHKPGCTTTENG